MPTGRIEDFTIPPALLAEIEHGLDERRRAEILAHVDEAEASIARGDGIAITQTSMRQLAEDVKQRGRARLIARRDRVIV